MKVSRGNVVFEVLGCEEDDGYMKKAYEFNRSKTTNKENNSYINEVVLNNVRVGGDCFHITLPDLMRSMGRTCCYCKFSESFCDDEDGYYCHCDEHNKNYLVKSGSYCSNWQEKDNGK